MHFAEPIWLVAGAATVTLLVSLLVRAEILRSRALARLPGLRIAGLPSPARRWAKAGVLALAVAMGFLALSRPQRGLRWATVERKGADLMLVVDTSRSMDADDVHPTRLERTKLSIRDLVAKLPGDRIGLVAFAGDAFVESPMTLDHAALLETVDALDSSIVARGGTDIGHAIDVASSALATEPEHGKSIVLVTDGEDLDGHAIDEAKKVAAAGIVVDTVGVGSPAGELVPQRDERGRAAGLVRDEDGKPVRSRLDETTLRSIAEAAHGTYLPLGADGLGLQRLYDAALAPRAKVESAARTHRVYRDLYMYPLALALGGLALDALLGLAWRPRKRGAGRHGMVAAVALALFVPRAAHASTTSAAHAYEAHRFDEAEKDYAAESAKHPDDPRLAYDTGDAAYRAGHFAAAEAAFQRALGHADAKLKPHVLYNQGNALYRRGETAELAQKKEAWKAAIAAYDGTLATTPADADARFNRDLVARKLATLDEKPKEPPPPPPKSQDDKKDKDDKKNGKGQDPKDKDGKGQDPKDKDGKGQDGQSKDARGKDPKAGDKGNEPHDQTPGGPPPAGQAPPQAPGAPSAEGSDGSGKPPGQQLSEKEARALLNGLKGDERHAVVRGNDAGAPDNDAPRKDW